MVHPKRRMKSERDRLVIVEESPLNAEAPLSELITGVTSLPSFFVRSHFPVPQIDIARWRLTVEGRVGSLRSFSYDELRGILGRRSWSR